MGLHKKSLVLLDNLSGNPQQVINRTNLNQKKKENRMDIRILALQILMKCLSFYG